MKLIGKGAFTKAYLLDSGKVLLKSTDPIKEVMSRGWFPDSPLFPKVTLEGDDYIMDYYPKVRSLKKALEPEQYNIYKALRKVFDSITYTRNIYDAYNCCYKAFEGAYDNGVIDEELFEVMTEALNACSDIGSDVSFEISPRNVAVNNGKLILLDCFFSNTLLREVRGYK